MSIMWARLRPRAVRHRGACAVLVIAIAHARRPVVVADPPIVVRDRDNLAVGIGCGLYQMGDRERKEFYEWFNALIDAQQRSAAKLAVPPAEQES